MSENPACKGSQNVDDHTLIDLGRCAHRVGGATYTKEHQGCTVCGVTTSRTVIYACGTREKAERPTAENCIALKWKAERAPHD